MSKTITEIGLIAGGLALALVGFGVLVVPWALSSAALSTLAAVGVAAGTTGVSMLLQPTQPITVANGTLSVSNPVAYRRVCYGRTGINAGVPTFADYNLGNGFFQNGSPDPNQSGTSAGMENQCLHLVYTLCAHQITKFNAVVLDGISRTIDAPGTFTNGHLCFNPASGYYEIYQNPSNVVTDPYFDGVYTHRSLIFFEFDTGNPSNPGQPFPQLAAATPLKWTSVMKQRGCAKVHVVLRYSACLASNSAMLAPAPTNPFQGGRIPKMQFDIIGKPLTDPRRSGDDAWEANTEYDYQPTPDCILDPHGNLQMASFAPSFISNSTMPTWNTTVGGFTADGGHSQAWLNLGPVASATVAASNPALAVYDFLTNEEYGMAADPDSIDLSSVVAATNICDALAIELPNLTIENRYACDGMFDESKTRGDVLKALCDSMAGWVVPPGDKWRVYAGAYVPPTMTLTDADLRDAIKGDFRISRRDVCNGIRGKFFPKFLPVNANGPWAHGVPPLWEQTDFPPYQGDAQDGRPNWLAEDGGQILWNDIELGFTTSIWMCQRLAKIQLQRLRYQVTLHLACKLSAWQLRAGDTVTFVHDRWTGLDPAPPTVYFVQQVTLVVDTSHGAPALGVDLVLRQYDPAIYDFAGSEYSPYNSTGAQ